MNHLKHYIKLVKLAKERGIPEKNYEWHHIFPKSIYGNNLLVVPLTIREHLVAHLLLWKACETRYGETHWKTKKMCFAASQMGWKRKGGVKLNSNLLALARMGMSKFLEGDNNPSKTQESREKISNSKLGISREDMKGKRYFGADEATILQARRKISASKTGIKNPNYPKNTKRPACSMEKAKKISIARLNTKYKYINMSDEEFSAWLNSIPKYRKDERRNSNVTRALMYRGIDVETYYEGLENES